MTTREMDPVFASALREALIANVERALLACGVAGSGVWVSACLPVPSSSEVEPRWPQESFPHQARRWTRNSATSSSPPARGPRLSTSDLRQPPRRMFR